MEAERNAANEAQLRLNIKDSGSVTQTCIKLKVPSYIGTLI